MKKIVLSVAMIAAVAAIAIGATTAYFSDTETSTGNTFTAGSLDLTIDSKATYNGVTAEYGNWSLKDLGRGDLFFNLADVKPGDKGEDTVSMHVNNNDACGFVTINKNGDSDFTCTEPELAEEPGCVPTGDGELDENTIFTIWSDMAVANPNSSECANVQPGDNIYSPNCGDVPLTTGTLDEVESWGIGKLAGDSTTYFGIGWEVPISVTNNVQTDKFGADIEFRIEQFRNHYNSDKPCPIGEFRD
jgi:predicted ribosomally synthesized peptide with SipW-like signal peptide